MGTVELILLVFISVLSLQVTEGQVFDFPEPIEYDHECGLQNLVGSWAVNGTLKMTGQDFLTFDSRIIIETATKQVCSIDLATCLHGIEPTTTDFCYCSHNVGNLYHLAIRRRPRTSESGAMLQASIASHDVFNPTKVSSNIGVLPVIYGDVLGTYQIDKGQVNTLLSAQTVDVIENVPTRVRFCVINLLSEYTLKITLNDKETTTTTHSCVDVLESFDFSDSSTYKIKFSYKETNGCGRSGSYVINIKGHKDESFTRTCPQDPYLPNPLPTGICAKKNESCPREIATLSNGVKLLCDTSTAGGNWIVFQRRVSGDVDFYRNWTSYQDGFGDLSGNFWLGLEKIHQLCAKVNCTLRVDLQFKGKTYFAEYDHFSLSGAADNYKLTVSGYSGDAGDYLTYHNGMAFTTKDRDNDDYSTNCASSNHGAWWFKSCAHSHLNGIWGKSGGSGLYWWYSPMSFSEMKLKIRA